MAIVDKSLLGMCMGEMYPDSFVMYREYVQNACDAIEQAEEAHLYQSPNERVISILINKDDKEVTIHDRGIGVKLADVQAYLVDLGKSPKRNNPNFIGQYGIGRLIGAHYCDKIIYETSAKDEDKESIVTFDAKKAWEIVNSDDEMQCGEAVELVTKVDLKIADPKEHFFRVKLINVSKPELLNEDNVCKYLSVTAPVDYSFEFKEDVLNPALESDLDYQARFKNIKTWKITVNGKDARKLYDPQIHFSSNPEDVENVGKVGFMSIRDDEEELAWGWYAMSMSSRQMNDLPFKGIRLREHNVAIGTYDRNYDILSARFPKMVDYNYFIGEIFITSKDIKPSSARDGLQYNSKKDYLIHEIEKTFKILHSLYDTSSRMTAKLKTLASSYKEVKIAEKKLQRADETDDKEILKKKCKEASEDLNKKIEETSEFYNKKIKSEFQKDLVSDSISYVNNIVNGEISDYNKKTDVIKKNAQVKPIGFKDLVSSKVTVSISDTSTKAGPDEQKKVDTGEDKTPTSGPKTPSELEPYKSLSQVEQKLMKKVYSVLNAPSSKIPPKILERIKKKLIKKIVDA